MLQTNDKIILAKPTGIPLDQHIANLLTQAEMLFAGCPIVLKKYRRLTGEDFAAAVKHSARWHDEGKKHSDWQTPCQDDWEDYQKTPDHRKEKFRGKHLQRVTIRHELASLEYIYRTKAKVSVPVRVAVASHHGKLSRRDKHKKRWAERPEFLKFWEEFAQLDAQVRRRGLSATVAERYRFAGVRAWLQLVDHRASAYEQGQPLPEFTPFAYTFPAHWEKRGVQKIVPEFWDEPFSILRAPTGAGKTDAALLWAQHQVEQRRAQRVIFAMPTRFTANALSITKASDLSALGLYHSSAWYQRRKEQELTPEEEKFIDKEQELARRLEMPCVVTTIDHLCICLTGTREDHHGIFFGLANSCVVIDEADFYDAFTQANIVILLSVLRLLQVPVLLMSATVPESARTAYAESGFRVPPIFEDRTDYERVRCTICKYGPAATPDDVAELLARALDGTPTIIYANTVTRAQAYYAWFQREITARKKKYDPCELSLDDVVLYHSRFTEPHKLNKERQLTDLLGKDAWADGQQRGVAILTQIGEISVNISADLMISDLCPLDRMAQRAGRLSRFSRSVTGELFVVEPRKENKDGNPEPYPPPYGTYRSGTGWIPSPYLLRSNELLTEGDYSARTFVEKVNELYPTLDELPTNARANSKKLKELICHNWLILPAEEVQEDQEDTINWSCRDIAPQCTVYAEEEPSNFDFADTYGLPTNKTELRRWEIRHGINIYAYEFYQAITDGLLICTPLNIGYEKEPVIKYLIASHCYDAQLGLRLKGISEDGT